MTSSDSPAGGTDPARLERSTRAPSSDDQPLLPDRGEGDRDEAWGDATGDRDAGDRRLYDERPPHHDGLRSW